MAITFLDTATKTAESTDFFELLLNSETAGVGYCEIRESFVYPTNVGLVNFNSVLFHPSLSNKKDEWGDRSSEKIKKDSGGLYEDISQISRLTGVKHSGATEDAGATRKLPKIQYAIGCSVDNIVFARLT